MEMKVQLDVSLPGPYRLTRAFANPLIDGEGPVMTGNSIAGHVSGPFSGAYGIGKRGSSANGGTPTKPPDKPHP